MSLFRQGDDQYISNVLLGYRPTPIVPSKTKAEWREYDKKEREELQINLKKIQSGELKVSAGLHLGMCPNTWCHSLISLTEEDTFGIHEKCYVARCDQCDKTFLSVCVKKDEIAKNTSSSTSRSSSSMSSSSSSTVSSA